MTANQISGYFLMNQAFSQTRLWGFMGFHPKLTWVFYGALPHTPPAFLKKAGEKQYFTAKYPTHFVRAILCGFFCFFKFDCLNLRQSYGLDWRKINFTVLACLSMLFTASHSSAAARLSFGEKQRKRTWLLMFYSEFLRLNLCRTNGYGFAKDKIYYFSLLVRKYCSSVRRPLFFKRKAEQRNLIFRLFREFACWHLWHTNGQKIR